MKRNPKTQCRDSQSGFSIIELMLAVGIVGVLSAVALPAYDKYRSRARTAEIKLSLSGIYVAEKAFHLEHQMYTVCLNVAGFSYNDPRTNYYSVGFYRQPDWMPPVCGKNSDSYCNISPNNEDVELCVNGDGQNFFLGQRTFPIPTTVGTRQACETTGTMGLVPSVSNDAFFIMGGGKINNAPSDILHLDMDVWSIDHNKNLVHQRYGY